MVKRTVLLGAALAVVGQSILMAGPAVAKTKTRTCPTVTVGSYEATDVRVTSNLGCAAAKSDLRIWLKHPSKLPRSSKGWHSKQVRGTWEMAYGHYPVSLFFVLVKLQPPAPTPTPTSTPPPTSTTTSTPTPTPTPTPNPTPTPKQTQKISFTSTAPAHPIVNGFPYTVTASASSGLPVTLTLDGSSTGCTLSGASVSFTAAGTCVIDANQAGNATYNAAPQADQSLAVTQAKTVVTLTFDDGYEDMIANALPVLQKDGLHGTFYIISGALNDNGDDPAYMTWSQLATIYQDGNEIGSHSVLHEALPQVDTDEAIQELCQDRYDLMNPPGLAAGSLGPITSFAYPDGEGVATGSPNTTTDPSTWSSTSSDAASTTTIESLLKACGYNSARTVDGVDDGTGPASVPLTSTDQYDPTTADSGTTFDDPLDMPTTPSIGSDDNITTASQVESWVTGAETADKSTNGWLSLTFHDICSGTCNSPDGYQMATAQFTSLMTWVQQQEQAGNIVVRTMGQVVGGTDNPAVAPATTSPTNEWSGVGGWTSARALHGCPVVNSTFADATNPNTWYSGPGGPPCYQLQQSGSSTVTAVTTGTNGTGYISRVTPTSTPPNSATEAGQIAVTKASSGSDAGIVTLQDLGECSPILSPGTTYTLSADYQSTGAPVFFDVFIRSDTGSWTYWTDDSATPFAATTGTTWDTASWTLPQALPAGYDGISFGLSVGAPTTLAVDGYSMTG